jgi:hypothetical protein
LDWKGLRKQDCWHIENTGIQTHKNGRMTTGVAEEGAGRAEEVQNKVTECSRAAVVERPSVLYPHGTRHVLYPHGTCHVSTKLYSNSGGVRGVGVRRRQACGKNLRPTGLSKPKGESCTRSSEIQLCLYRRKVADISVKTPQSTATLYP